MRRALLTFAFAGAASVALAMVGGAPPATDAVARRVALIVGSRGNFCSGVALARDLVLTVAHCVVPGADYKLVEYDAKHQPLLRDVAKITRHPQFDLKALLGHRATADVALLKLAQPADLAPALLARSQEPVAVGDRFLVAGYGVAVRGDGRSGGQVRAVTLSVTGQPGGLQIRLLDPSAGSAGGLGACTGDSGAPVFAPSEPLTVIGLVSWSTGPGLSDGCGGLTGVTPLARYRGWIADQAAKLGSPLP
jgi:secreted trypsin-like serine protease